jgi:steroid 5-alpha reductase family enzyme
MSGVWPENQGFRMTLSYLEAVAVTGVSLSILMAGAWVVQQRTANSGWIDTAGVRHLCGGAFSRRYAAAARLSRRPELFMYWILVHVTGVPPRGERYRDQQFRTSRFFPLPPQPGVAT